MSNQINYYTNNNDANNISTYDDSQVITQIVYNDKVIPIPTPLVSIERENLYYNQYWGNSDKIVLDGYTYGNGCSPFNKIVDNQKNILGIFNQNFGNFQIFERGPILSKTFTLQSPLYKISEFAADPTRKTFLNGLYGKKYIGYFTDDPYWFTTGTLQGEVNQLTNINNFSSNENSYSWQWLGYFKPSTTETYTFYTESSDSSILWVGNSSVINYNFQNLVVDNTGIHELQEKSGLVNLDAGIYYPIRIQFGEEFEGGSMTVSFSTPTISKTTDGLGYYYYDSGQSDYIENIYRNDFGYSVSIDSNGHTAVIGAPHDIYGETFISYKTENGWSSLISLTGTGYYHRGTLVKVNNSGNLVVSAESIKEGYPISTGVFCFYTGYKNDWTLVSTVNLEKPTGIFSSSMDINASGNILLVGSQLDDNEGINNIGSVYIFTGNNYNLKFCQRITGESISGNFGCAVALNDNGNVGIIGAKSSNLDTGLAWVITGNGIRWEKAFQLSGGNTGQTQFGNAVAINSSGNIIFVGHEFDENERGAVHIFTGDGNIWVEAAKISGDAENIRFGSAIDLNSSGNIGIISAMSDSNNGSVSIITGDKNNWNKISKIFLNRLEYGSEIFGYSISVNSTGNRIIVGNPNFDSKLSGSASLYEQDFDYEKIYENSGIIVRSINFNESNYAGLVDYTIELNSIRVSGNVIDPTNEFQFTENENKTISLSHSISAKGINTNLNQNKSNALNNAISFVRANTGLANVPSMQFISGNINKFYLQNFSESIDRLNAIYSVQETYTNNYLDNSLSGNLTYSIDINSGSESNSLEINIRGQYKGQKDGNINDLRNSLNVTGLITGVYNGYYNPVPLQYNITENTGENFINFDYSFDNINLPNPYYKYDSNISRDELEQIYNIQVRGDIIARGNRSYRYFLSTGNIINLTGQFISIASGILTGFKDFNNDSTISNLRLLSVNIEQNPNDGTISANASYDDKFMPTGNAVDASYNISVEAPRWYMNNQATCNVKGFHIINDFDITTLPKISANTSLKYKNITGINNENEIRSEIKNITKNIIPTNYNFNTKLQDSESYTKKYNSINSITEISYNLDKIDLSNENGLLPKFNTI